MTIKEALIAATRGEIRRQSWERDTVRPNAEGFMRIVAHGANVLEWVPTFDELTADDWEPAR